MILSGEVSGKMNRVCCGAVRSVWVISTESGGYHDKHHHFSAGFGIKGIMEVQVRQYGFGKFIVIK